MYSNKVSGYRLIPLTNFKILTANENMVFKQNKPIIFTVFSTIPLECQVSFNDEMIKECS